MVTPDHQEQLVMVGMDLMGAGSDVRLAPPPPKPPPPQPPFPSPPDHLHQPHVDCALPGHQPRGAGAVPPGGGRRWMVGGAPCPPQVVGGVGEGAVGLGHQGALQYCQATIGLDTLAIRAKNVTKKHPDQQYCNTVILNFL